MFALQKAAWMIAVTFAFAFSSANVHAAPALWKMSDEDTTIYLFGTIHILPPELEWESQEITDSFNAADILVLEAPTDETPELGQAVLRLGFYPSGETLSDHLSEAEIQNLEAGLSAAGLPFKLANINSMRPWYASLISSLTFFVQNGHDINSGVEKVLAARAKAQGKDMRYFESQIQQLHFFADLDESLQMRLLLEGVADLENGLELIERMDDAWMNSDIDDLGEIMVEMQVGDSDEFYQVLIARRNLDWVSQIKPMMDEAGVFFIAVGAGHLAGKDSVIKHLRDAGYKIEGP